MPGTRSRRSAATVVVEKPEEVEQEEEEEPAAGLAFNEPLTWKAGKAIPVAELLRRLQALSQELRGLEQEEADRDALAPVAKELASHNLLGHKDKGVRAWTACCLVDMFRLCAPEAPYTGPQLKDIFTLFVSTIFPALADPSNPYNGQHLFVLKSLAEVKSIVLLTDIPGSGNLFLSLIVTCFDILSGPSKAETGEELSKNVEHHMTAVLTTLVDESPSLPTDVVDVILAQFLRADPRALTGDRTKNKKGNQMDERQSTLLLKEAPPAYNMAKNICNSCADKMARYLTQYFSAAILDATSASTSTHKTGKGRSKRAGSDDSEDEGPRAPSEEDLQETRKAHRLLRELWRSTPSVLQDIIPQLEAELGAEDVQLRTLATETIGDIISGIGAAGPPPPPSYNPVGYPSQSLASSNRTTVYNFLTTPTSPHSFASRHHQVYQSFLSRRNDKSPIIRSAWVTEIGRILMTNAGGVGLDPEDEQTLLRYLADMLVDGDERVRLSAVKAVERFEFNDIIQKLGSKGSVSEQGSILSNLADRVKDRKPMVRTEAMKLLGKIWGVAAQAITEGSERVGELLGPIPSRILDACYLNDLEVNTLVDHVLFESLLPLAYPAIKTKPNSNGSSQRVKDSQANGETETYTEADADRIRTERELTLIRDLTPRSKVVLFARQSNQPVLSKALDAFLKKCEDYNGGVMDKGEKEIKLQLGKLIDYHAKQLPDQTGAAGDLWKFAKMHDRRSYQLIRFCMAPDSDYRKVYKAFREFNKRMEEATGSTATMLETLIPLIYRVSVLLYNKSHVPAIIEFSRNDSKGLGSTAHEVLKEISARNPDVFRGYIQQMCRSLETEAPSSKKPNGPGAVDDLKACAGFARRFPKDVPTERKFIQSMISFAQYGSPPKAAKYGVSIIMSCADKKEMHARDILHHCTSNFKYGEKHYLSKLAAMSQLMLLGSKQIDDEIDDVVSIAINKVLLVETPVNADDNPEWSEEPDEDCTAKMWALKILVNRLRGISDDDSAKEASVRVYETLNHLVRDRGELPRKKPSPDAHKNRMRLLASQLLLKLCRERRFDSLLTPKDFNELATVVQDPCSQVREGFVKTLMKYLGQDKLPRRFYPIVFLLAFEPKPAIKDSAVTWIRARNVAFNKANDFVFENSLSRFISLLAHHPDFDREVENLKDFVQYLMFYLKCVANDENLSLIYHVAQRVKSVADGIDSSASENLYVLSDLAQAVIQRFKDANGWSMQAFPKKARMPADIFANLPGHEAAQDIAEKQYVPEELVEELDDLVRAALKTKKRKHDPNADSRTHKRSRPSTASTASKPRKPAKAARTPKPKKTRNADSAPSSEIRRSGRNAGNKSYVELSDEEGEGEDVDMDGGEEEEDEDGDGDEEEEAGSSQTVQDTPAKRRGGAGRGKAKGGKGGVAHEDEDDEELSDPPESGEDDG